MLKRAENSVVLAVIAALLGFAGLPRPIAMVGQVLFYVLVGFCLLSLLLSLFEDAEETSEVSQHVET
jgi:uncharacterized membrane protein YtjA (UPF0391 family)